MHNVEELVTSYISEAIIFSLVGILSKIFEILPLSFPKKDML